MCLKVTFSRSSGTAGTIRPLSEVMKPGSLAGSMSEIM